MITLGGDVIGVPVASRLRHGLNFRHIYDGACAVAWIWSFVINIDLVGIDSVDEFGITDANEDAAVGFIIHPKLSLNLKVLVGFV